MDHNKINYDLIVAILEWIVGKEHEVTTLHCLCNIVYMYIYMTEFMKTMLKALHQNSRNFMHSDFTTPKSLQVVEKK